MKVIVPMAGNGKRFDDYLSPKPLIEIEGKPMVEHAQSCLPKNSEFIFLCNEYHLRTTHIEKTLRKIYPSCQIISVPLTHLRGPAYTMLLAFDSVDDNEEVIVNYCDTIQIFNFEDFLKRIREINPDGAMLSFKGFHPASLGETYYAYLRTDPNNFVKEVREKRSFSEDRKEDPASTGMHYFSSGKLMKKYVSELVSSESNAVNGEFYMSMPFNLMARDNLKVLNYEVEKFISLGIPRDYELYKFWSEFFLKYSKDLGFDNINVNLTNIFPIAGGERDFQSEGFDGLNSMLPLMGKTLMHYSFKSNPKGIKNIFIGLKEHKNMFDTLPLFSNPKSHLILLDEKRNGNAATIYSIKNEIDLNSPICISGSTLILDYNERKLNSLMMNDKVDVILFSFSHHECVLRNPNGFAYAKLNDQNEVEEIIEKRTISENPYNDQALTGTAIFKKAGDLFDAIDEEIRKSSDHKLYYLSCLNNLLKKKKVVIFEVDKFVPLRTPIDYKEFKYWEDYFDRLGHHPYSK